MVRQRKTTGQDLLRLDAIAKHLKAKSRYPNPTFSADVAAARARIAPVVDKLLPCTGEQISLALAEHLCLTFEEVHGPHDVEKLKKTLPQGQERDRFRTVPWKLNQPGVDALLFERMYAEETRPTVGRV